ncbi:hypothetical protein [Anaeroselena agilis]|uniref:Uncharacterized protein n=1 Tax=Anaeroselena agilis TaxID=3063788 RepID=A0ABU3P3K9_9FIRM|nr:hypothetical protein [Selenomonadales bacterium 4137-cl]
MKHAPVTELTVPLQVELLPVVTGCVEQSAQAFGLQRSESLALALATEEVFSYLAAKAAVGQSLRVTCRGGGYYAEVVCRFPGRALPVRALNITAAVADDEASLEEMGFLLAARTVDRLAIATEGDSMSVSFVKEKAYPPAPAEVPPPFAVKGAFREYGDEPELLKQFARRVTAAYGRQAPPFFRFPGKIVDMVAGGEYGAVMLADDNRNIGGGMFWRKDAKMAEAYGPYVFVGASGLARDVVDACLRRFARTGTLCLVIPAATAEAPRDYFEPLGRLPLTAADGRREEEALYRQLEEDNGSLIYVHPALATFVRDAYDRLCLPRQIEEVASFGEARSPYSAFAVSMDRPANKAVLSPIWVGEDAAASLAEHVRSLEREGVVNIFFKLDAGVAGKALLGPALLAAGFRPRLIIPWEGRGDVIVFAHQEGGE